MTISNDRAAYRILALHGFFGPDDHLYEMDQEIYFDGVPNEEMEPLNDLARARLSTYLEKLDSQAKEVAAKLGRPFIERPRTLDGAIALSTSMERSKMAIMSAQKEVTSVERVETDAIPEVGGATPKRGRGRPVGSTKKEPSLTIASHAT